jgi:hypothetical protein
MLSLILVVLAIVLSAILIAGGVNYLDLNAVSKVISANEFRVGKDAILVGVASYKMTHNGSLPPQNVFFESISKYMPRGAANPRMPIGSGDFSWNFSKLPDGRAAICLENKTKEPIDETIIANVISFAKKEAVTAYPKDVFLSDRCGNDVGADTSAEMSRSVLPDNTSVSVSFALQ